MMEAGSTERWGWERKEDRPLLFDREEWIGFDNLLDASGWDPRFIDEIPGIVGVSYIDIGNLGN